MKPTAVLISGNGTNLAALIHFWQQGDCNYDLKLVISNNPAVKGLDRAAAAGIETLVLDHRNYPSREEYDRAIDQALTAKGIQLIALAGFLRLLSSEFVLRWAGKMINIHPSLLPAFAGLHAHKKALQYGVKYSGCTVIFVDEGVDSGAVIDQAVVPVFEEDTEADLARRVLQEEHRIFPLALDDLASGQVQLKEGKVVRQTASNTDNPRPL